jgi:xyloglucan fucosyltransferase
VFHHLGRYLFNPSNTVWGMVTRYHDEYFAKADERVGIQVRTFSWAPISSDELYGQILNCSQREDILPVLRVSELAANADGQPVKQKAVLIVSLHGEYYEKLRDMYQKNGSTTGREAVSVYQPTHLGAQRSGEKEHNQQAFAEMVLLGFSEVGRGGHLRRLDVWVRWSRTGRAETLGARKPRRREGARHAVPARR